MDTPKPPSKPTELLSDLESIRQLLGADQSDPPLLVESIDPDSIPMLSDIVSPPPVLDAVRKAVTPPPSRAAQPAPPAASPLQSELQAAAELILQEVIDDFVPRIEAELKRRLQDRLTRLLPPRRS